MVLLAVGFAVGLALGLTGAGGSIIAVPLLIFSLDLRPQDAMGISLGAVSAAAMVGVLVRRQQHPPFWGAALSLAITGMCAAPAGRWLSNQLDERLIVVLFSLLAAYLALRMWREATAGQKQQMPEPDDDDERANEAVRLAVFLLSGAGIGLLSGLFGVGGGFLIVPFLSLYARMQMDKAISTSLLVIGLIGISGYVYHVLTSHAPDVQALSMIAVGSVFGILLGTALCTRLSGPLLQRVFSVFVVLVMSYTLHITLA